MLFDFDQCNELTPFQEKGYYFDGQRSFVNYNDELEKAKPSYSTSQRVLVIEDVDGFLKELCRFAFSCPDGSCSLICSSFLNDMIRCGIMKRYEGLGNDFQSFDSNRSTSSSGKGVCENDSTEILNDSQDSDVQRFHHGNSLQSASSYDPSSLWETELSRDLVGLGDYLESNDEFGDPPSLSESELASSDNDSTNSSQTNESCSQESSESKRPWYERLKPCAGDIYIRGRVIKGTCKECCDDNDEAKNLIGKFYNMNSDGFKKELESIKEDNPSEDPYYLLDLVLCAHVRKGYSFDLSKKGSKRERFERKWINWIRRDKHRIQKKQKKKEKGSKRVSYSS